MKEISVSITVGEGSEKHNHDLDYRKSLEHTHNMDNGVIELVPYKSYKEVINNTVKPYINEYNTNIQNRYNSALERFKNGKIKNRPKLADYKKLDYDYYDNNKNNTVINPNTHKVEKIPIFREMIIGLGDKADREDKHIKEKQAINIFKKVLDDMKTNFPNLVILGFSIHLDEQGYYHAHIDYKPITPMKMKRGLNISTSQDTALEAMGYEKEQSIINGRDKIPLYFNAMRNKFYQLVEQGLRQEHLYLQYNASATKAPYNKVSSKHTKLEDWQQVQDSLKSIQHNKNIIMSTLDKDTFCPNDYKNAEIEMQNISNQLINIDNSRRSRINHKKIIVPYSLYDQLKSTIDIMRKFMVQALQQLQDKKEINNKNKQLSIENQSLEKQLQHEKEISLNLQEENTSLNKDIDKLKNPQNYTVEGNKSLDALIKNAAMAALHNTIDKCYSQNPQVTQNSIDKIYNKINHINLRDNRNR